MVQITRLIVCGLLIAAVSTTSAQDDAPKKKRGKGKNRQGGAMLLKKLEAAQMTDDQMAKVGELTAKMKADMQEIRDAGLTQEMSAQKRKLTDELRKAETKQKEISAKVLAEFGEEKTKLFKKATNINNKFRNGVYALLTKEQIDKLPEEVKKQVTMAREKAKNSGKGKNRKKKKPSTES